MWQCDERRGTRTSQNTTGMIGGKSSRVKQLEQVLDGLTKQLKVDRATDTLKSDEGYRCAKDHDRLR